MEREQADNGIVDKLNCIKIKCRPVQSVSLK